VHKRRQIQFINNYSGAQSALSANQIYRKVAQMSRGHCSLLSDVNLFFLIDVTQEVNQPANESNRCQGQCLPA
jgi:hypothetical protein